MAQMFENFVKYMQCIEKVSNITSNNTIHGDLGIFSVRLDIKLKIIEHQARFLSERIQNFVT